MEWLGLYNYWVVVVLMMTGFWIVIAHGNLLKKIIGLNVFQAAVILFYVTIGKLDGGTAPIVTDLDAIGAAGYANPLPHVLMLTAIVVGVAITAVGLALVVRIRDAYGTIEEDEFKDDSL
ncbi:MAG: cation:proton antiporter subunit C [Gammaproteobacteria bacterium]